MLSAVRQITCDVRSVHRLLRASIRYSTAGRRASEGLPFAKHGVEGSNFPDLISSPPQGARNRQKARRREAAPVLPVNRVHRVLGTQAFVPWQIIESELSKAVSGFG
jgi:hypothetical protein